MGRSVRLRWPSRCGGLGRRRHAAELSEIWLDSSLEYTYIDAAVREDLSAEYDQIGKTLGTMISTPDKFCYASKKPR